MNFQSTVFANFSRFLTTLETGCFPQTNSRSDFAEFLDRFARYLGLVSLAYFYADIKNDKRKIKNSK